MYTYQYTLYWNVKYDYKICQRYAYDYIFRSDLI